MLAARHLRRRLARKQRPEDDNRRPGHRMTAALEQIEKSRPERNRMDAFYERLIVRAATIDELLSDDFEPLPGQKGDADLAARRLAAWCRSCASGDWSLFGRRLDRDGWTFDQVLTRFATVRRKASARAPTWIDDAIWIEAALQSPTKNARPTEAHRPDRALRVRTAVHASGRTSRGVALVGYRHTRRSRT